jgi:hypothetical protein
MKVSSLAACWSLLIGGSLDAFAFSCGRSKEPAHEIFIGVPIEIQDWRRFNGQQMEESTTRFVFKVERMIKGDARKKFAVVETTNEWGMFPFELNERYRVHTRDRSERGLSATADVCGGTEPLPSKSERKAK